MTVTSAWVGAVQDTLFHVVTQVSSTATVRLAVDDHPSFTAPSFGDPVTPTAQLVARVSVGGLDPDTDYYWAVEHDGVLDISLTGQVHTHPQVGQPASFRIAAASCAGGTGEVPGIGTVLASNRLSNHGVFTTIGNLEPRPLMFIHMGDIHYYDLGSGNHGIVGGGSLANYRRSYEDVLRQTNQHALYRKIPISYVWDDHDYGPNDSDGTLATKANAQQAYRERVPHYSMVESAAIYHSFQVGRVLFVVSDTRSYRSPNGDPDGPSKTMLGADQKAWMASLLSTSDAALLVWVMPSQWMGTGSDTWASFQTEQDELVEMFSALDWLDKMCIVSGDIHSMAIDTGGNSPGGFPVFQFASLDSTPTATAATQYDTGPALPGRNQYGTIDIADDGNQITVTGNGWVGTSLWRTHSFVVGDAPTPPPNGGGTPDVAVAHIRTRVTWLGCRLGDGRIIAELPDITGPVSRVIGRYTSAQLGIPIPRGGPGAVPLATVLQATEPARTLLVAVVNDIPTWAGIPLPRQGGTDAMLELGAVSVEGYLEHRYVRDHTWTQQDQTSVIAAGLLADAGDLAGVGSGIGLIIDAPASGRLRDREYLASDHKTVYEALTELMAVEDGPEWSIDPDWTDDTMTAVRLIARVRSRLGTAALQPPAVFETTAHSVFGSRGSSDATYRYLEDLSGDRFANVVQAYSSGEGEDQPVSTLAVDAAALAGGAPIFERHFQPSTSIVETATLNQHATAELARIQRGALTWQISSRWDAYPRYGLDWRLGDDVAWQLVGHRHPAGITGQGRAIGFELDMQAGLIRPILQEDT